MLDSIDPDILDSVVESVRARVDARVLEAATDAEQWWLDEARLVIGFVDEASLNGMTQSVYHRDGKRSYDSVISRLAQVRTETIRAFGAR